MTDDVEETVAEETVEEVNDEETLELDEEELDEEELDNDEAVDEASPILFEDSEPETEVERLKREVELLKQHGRAQGQQQTPAAKPKVQLGKKPKLEDHDFDGEKFDQALSKWYEAKAEADRQEAEAKAAEEEAQSKFNDTLNKYKSAKAALSVDDYDLAESTVLNALDLTQQGILISGADRPEILVYALGKSRTKIAELAKIKDPIKFAFAVAKMEEGLVGKGKKVDKNRPAPEKPLKNASTGNGGAARSSTKQLDRLRDEAAKTGDYSKVVAFKKKMKERQQSR